MKKRKVLRRPAPLEIFGATLHVVNYEGPKGAKGGIAHVGCCRMYPDDAAKTIDWLKHYVDWHDYVSRKVRAPASK